ncbi:MAG: ParB N-terminal domain-containing protein [Coleofasciculus sp. C1-SOL-03]|jgi:hypothetical protein|uniref:hypothetical protein n=1 Tax=Coleofasciculus sp. C1-SOL-03 TaxID=3069522 RepID=UPI0032FE7474
MQIQQVRLSDIQTVSSSELEPKKLKALENSYDSFESQLNSQRNPIALDRGAGKPYQILDGRHRVYLARKKGYSSVPATFG